MTRISGYDIVACPSCGQQHTLSRYASISAYIPKRIADDSLRACTQCGVRQALDEFSVVGFIDKSQMTPPSRPPLLRHLLRGNLRLLLVREGQREQVLPWGLPFLR